MGFTLTTQNIFALLKNMLLSVKGFFVNPDSQVGIKETAEAITGINTLGLFFVSKFKDGVQFGDFGDLWTKLQTDAEFKANLQNAFDNYKAIPAEVKDLDGSEGIDLAVLQISFVEQFMAELKAPEAPEAPVAPEA